MPGECRCGISPAGTAGAAAGVAGAGLALPRGGDKLGPMKIELQVPPKLGRELEELAREQDVSVETLILNGTRLLLEHRYRRNVSA